MNLAAKRSASFIFRKHLCSPVSGITQNQRSFSSNNDSEELPTKILDAAIGFVPSHGWTQNSVIAGAESLKLPGVSHGIFENPELSLVSYFYTKSNKEMAKRLETFSQEKKRQKVDSPSEFIFDAVRIRLEMLEPYIDSWEQALVVLIKPQNLSTAFNLTFSVADEIWHQSGDTAVDMPWYSKRLSLMGIYQATELFMVQDNSENLEETWQFLDRRFEEIDAFSRTSKSVTKSAAMAGDLTKAAYHIARNIMGIRGQK